MSSNEDESRGKEKIEEEKMESAPTSSVLNNIGDNEGKQDDDKEGDDDERKEKNLVLTVDEPLEEPQDPVNVNLNINNLDMKTNARCNKLATAVVESSDVETTTTTTTTTTDTTTVTKMSSMSLVEPSSQHSAKGAAAAPTLTTRATIRRVRSSSSTSSIEDNSTAATMTTTSSSQRPEHVSSAAAAAAALWTDTEALLKQHEQTGASACGATAILNVLVCQDRHIIYYFRIYKLNSFD